MSNTKSNTQDSTASAVQNSKPTTIVVPSTDMCQTILKDESSKAMYVRLEVSGYYDLLRMVENLGKAARIINDLDEGEAAVVSDMLHLQGQLLPFSEAEFLDKLLHKKIL